MKRFISYVYSKDLELEAQVRPPLTPRLEGGGWLKRTQN